MPTIQVQTRLADRELDDHWQLQTSEGADGVLRAVFHPEGLDLHLGAQLAPELTESMQDEDDVILQQGSGHPAHVEFPTASIVAQFHERFADTPPGERPVAEAPSLADVLPEEIRLSAGELLESKAEGGLGDLLFTAPPKEDISRDGERALTSDDLLSLLVAETGGSSWDLVDEVEQLLTREVARLPETARERCQIRLDAGGVSLTGPGVYPISERTIRLLGFRRDDPLHARRLDSVLGTIRRAHRMPEGLPGGLPGGIEEQKERWLGLLDARFGAELNSNGSKVTMRGAVSGNILLSRFHRHRSEAGARTLLELSCPVAVCREPVEGLAIRLMKYHALAQPFAFRQVGDLITLGTDWPVDVEGALEEAVSLAHDLLALGPQATDALLVEWTELRAATVDDVETWRQRPVRSEIELSTQVASWLYQREKTIAGRLWQDGDFVAILNRARAVAQAGVRDQLFVDQARRCTIHGMPKEAEAIWPQLASTRASDQMLILLLRTSLGETKQGRERLLVTWMERQASRLDTGGLDEVLLEIRRVGGGQATVDAFPGNGPLPLMCAWLAFLIQADPELINRDEDRWELVLGGMMERLEPGAFGEDLEPAIRLHGSLQRCSRVDLAESWAEALAPVLAVSAFAEYYTRRLQSEA